MGQWILQTWPLTKLNDAFACEKTIVNGVVDCIRTFFLESLDPHNIDLHRVECFA